jgi:hypothetical protein
MPAASAAARLTSLVFSLRSIALTSRLYGIRWGDTREDRPGSA